MTARNSESVKWVQSSLRELGDTELAVDGAAGPRTTAAIKKFQAGHGLTADGIAGPATVAAIEKALAERQPDPPGELRTMAVSADPADDDAADAETGEDEPAPAREAVVTPGAGYVEKRVKVRTYGTTANDSRLLVNVPSTSGTKRLHVLAAKALEAMSAAVQRDLGIELKLASGWRAHRWTSREQYEQVLIARFGSVKEGKRWLAFDSPHETGLAMDIGVGGLKPTRSTVDFQRKQPLHHWLVQHASEYGWYPYKTEPWHWEYPLSLEAFASGVVGPDDPGPPEDSVAFDLEDEEFALEAEDLEEFAVGDEP
jgi:peptidoglycan hydrolase-like protein with peptidoglycan-binding domain